MELRTVLVSTLLRTAQLNRCGRCVVTPAVCRQLIRKNCLDIETQKRMLSSSRRNEYLHKFYRDSAVSSEAEKKSFQGRKVEKCSSSDLDDSSDFEENSKTNIKAFRSIGPRSASTSRITQVDTQESGKSVGRFGSQRFQAQPLQRNTPHKRSNNSINLFTYDSKGVERITKPYQSDEPKKDVLEEVTTDWVKGYFIRLKHLPWFATAEDVVSFLSGVRIIGGQKGVKFTYSLSGRAKGEAYLQLYSKEDLDLALQKHETFLNDRCIIVEKTTSRKTKVVLNRYARGGVNQTKTGHFIYMSNLPVNTTKEDILKFLEPFEPVNVFDKTLSCGRARVDFASRLEAEDAMCKKKEKFQGQRVKMYVYSCDVEGTSDEFDELRQEK